MDASFYLRDRLKFGYFHTQDAMTSEASVNIHSVSQDAESHLSVCNTYLGFSFHYGSSDVSSWDVSMGFKILTSISILTSHITTILKIMELVLEITVESYQILTWHSYIIWLKTCPAVACSEKDTKDLNKCFLWKIATNFSNHKGFKNKQTKKLDQLGINLKVLFEIANF